MTDLKCHVCGAALLPATSFCRQCGSPNSRVVAPSEEPTAILEQTTEGVTTQRLDPRSTRPNRGQAASIPPVSQATADGLQKRRALMVMAIMAAGIAAFSIAAINRMRSHTPADATTISDSVLFYPGATSIVDMTNNDGSRTIQLETDQPLDRVESWYQTNLKPNKTVRLTSSSVVMKNQKVTVTLASEGDKTVILIKQLP